jgi:hypothetical protein
MLHAALLVILHLDMAEEHRKLSVGEMDLRDKLKRKSVALSVIERARKKQCARLACIKEGDANTRFFHLRVNARRRKNHIHRLRDNNNGWVTEHEAKEHIIHTHFKSTIARGPPRQCDFNWDVMHFQDLDLQTLGDPFSEEEVKSAIFTMPCDKAPGPDGFTFAFFKRSWDTIKADIMEVVHAFGTMHADNFHWLNSANIVLIPKKEGADVITDYRPISLIHSIAKIIAKMLALRLSPHMDDLVSNAQSAFIKKRSIHDNFLYVKNYATRLHKNRTPALLFKLDIRKAFDSVRWEYIVDLLQRRGFPSTFRNWVVALLKTSTSRVLLNGIAGDPIGHGRGLRQGDPLSPLLFVLAIDPLSQILDIATDHGLLHKLRGRGARVRTSLYADDAAVFVAPIKEDIQNLASILQRFGEVTGLCTNFQKSSVVPIRCTDLDLDDILGGIPAVRASFPLTYLGLPLSVWCLKRRDMQQLEDKCASRLPTWSGKLITTAGRTALVRSVITSQAIYYLTPLAIPAGTLKFVNKIQRAFLWAAKETTTGAKCKVNWEKVCRPKRLGGLGVLHLDKFATALRLRWPWLEWKDPSKIWVGSGNPCSDYDMDLFYSATTINLGNGKKTPFWQAPWLQGRKPIDIAPLIFGSSKRKNWKVAQALHNDAWVSKIDLEGTFTIDHMAQFIDLWTLISTIHLDPDVDDDIVWRLTANGHYSAKSAYELQFLGSLLSPMNKLIWKAWAPPKVKFFAWLLYQNRIWTADRLAKRGWPNCGLCPLCKQCTETHDHLFVHCRYTTRLWGFVKDWMGTNAITPLQWANHDIHSWWDSMTGAHVPNRKAMASVALLVSWELWNERNARVFNAKSAPPQVVFDKIRKEAHLWVLAGAKRLGNMMPRE